jgi:hypothetical protein
MTESSLFHGRFPYRTSENFIQSQFCQPTPTERQTFSHGEWQLKVTYSPQLINQSIN